MDLRYSDKNTFFKLFEEIIDVNHNLNRDVFVNINDYRGAAAMDKTYKFMKRNIEKADTAYKRQKIIMNDQFYVSPQELGIGIRTEVDYKNNACKNIQSTFQYISVIQTLKSLFRRPEFKELYFDYNRTHKHDCKEGEYSSYCCGSNFKQSVFFNTNPDALQLQFYVDDFEVCNNLSNRSTVHKMRGIYVQIRNLPQKFLSKIENIYLVALINVNDIRNTYDGFDHILSIMKEELRVLETEGLEIDGCPNLKGTIVNFSCDNAACNECFGFIECFNADFYCRTCKCKREECKILTEEKAETMRTVQEYIKCVKKGVVTDPKLNFGYKRYCLLNDLEEFHILNNLSCDVMHDVNEGIIIFSLQMVFDYIISEGILNDKDLIAKILNFNYGSLNRKNKPSRIVLKKKNFGLTASQLYLVLQCLPFILLDYEEKLIPVWQTIQSLLQICQILYSTKVTQDDVNILRVLVKTHLQSIKDNSAQHLKPKQHILTHYAQYIEKMGPVILGWCMRFESKNKWFIQAAKKNANFQNICKSLAKKHQTQLVCKGFTYTDKLLTSALKTVNKNDENYYTIYCSKFEGKEVFRTNSATYHNTVYKAHLVMTKHLKLFEILDIIVVENEIWILHRSIDIIRRNAFSNSLVISFPVSETPFLVKLEDFEDKSTHEIFKINGENHLIASSLSLPKTA